MIRRRILASIGAVAVGCALLVAATHPLRYFSSPPEVALHATLEQYCFRCHGGTAPRAGVNLKLLDFAHLEEHGVTWEKMLRKVRDREMPPAGRWRPDE